MVLHRIFEGFTRRTTLKVFRFHDLSFLRFSLGTENIIMLWSQFNLFSESLQKRHMSNMVIKFNQKVAGPCYILPVVKVVFVVLFPATNVLKEVLSQQRVSLSDKVPSRNPPLRSQEVLIF